MLCHYINQYAPGKRPHMQRIRTHLVDGSYVSEVIEEDYRRRQCYILAVIFAMIFCLLTLQGKPCWWYWNSNLIELRTLRLSSDLRTYILTFLLTYSIVQSLSWEANWFAASQEIPLISRNPKAHHRTHKRPPPVPILAKPNPVHIPTSHLLEIHPNIIHPSTHRSPQWSLSLRFPHQDPIHPPLLAHMRYMPSPSHSSRFYHPHNIGWGVQII